MDTKRDMEENIAEGSFEGALRGLIDWAFAYADTNDGVHDAQQRLNVSLSTRLDALESRAVSAGQVVRTPYVAGCAACLGLGQRDTGMEATRTPCRVCGFAPGIENGAVSPPKPPHHDNSTPAGEDLEYWRLQARRMVQVLGWSSWVVDDVERLARYARRTFGASLDVDRAAEYLSGRIHVLIASGEYTHEALQKVLSEWVAKGKSIVE